MYVNISWEAPSDLLILLLLRSVATQQVCVINYYYITHNKLQYNEHDVILLRSDNQVKVGRVAQSV